MERVVVTSSTAEHVYGTAGPVVLACFRGRPSSSSVTVLSRLCSTVRAKYPHLAILATAEDDAPPPETDVRGAFGSLLRTQGDKLVGVAFVVEGSGFRAAIVRGVAIGIRTLGRIAVPIQVTTTALDAATWIVERFPPPSNVLPASLLAADLQRLREAEIAA